MIKSLLAVLLFFPGLAFAQLERASDPVGTVDARLTNTVLPKSAPEVILPVSIDSLECAGTATFYTLGPPNTGYYTGTNSAFIQAVVQRFTYEVDGPFQISEVGVAFATADTTLETSRTISALIFNDLSADGSIGSLLGVSDSITVGDIVQPDSLIRFTDFTFSEPITVTRDSFWVYIDLSDIYEAAEGDVAVFSTLDSCGNGNNAFAVFEEGGEFSIVPYSGLGDPGANLELFIRAVVDSDVGVSTRQPLADYTTTLAPNPTGNRLTLQLPEPRGRKLHGYDHRSGRPYSTEFARFRN